MIFLFITSGLLMGATIVTMRKHSWLPIVNKSSIGEKITSFITTTIFTTLFFYFFSFCIRYLIIFGLMLASMEPSHFLAFGALYLLLLIFYFFYIAIIAIFVFLGIFLYKKSGRKLPKIRSLFSFIFNKATGTLLLFHLFIFLVWPTVDVRFDNFKSFSSFLFPSYVLWLVVGALIWFGMVLTISILVPHPRSCNKILVLLKNILYVATIACSIITIMVSFSAISDNLETIITGVQDRRKSNLSILT